MQKCEYCQFTSGNHRLGCPELMSGAEKEQALAEWSLGFTAGRMAEDPISSDDSYRLGYQEGNAARNSDQNQQVLDVSAEIGNLFDGEEFDDICFGKEEVEAMSKIDNLKQVKMLVES